MIAGLLSARLCANARGTKKNATREVAFLMEPTRGRLALQHIVGQAHPLDFLICVPKGVPAVMLSQQMHSYKYLAHSVLRFNF